MKVQNAIREPEKIELRPQADGIYRLAHAVAGTWKSILKAFAIDPDPVKKSKPAVSEYSGSTTVQKNGNRQFGGRSRNNHFATIIPTVNLRRPSSDFYLLKYD